MSDLDDFFYGYIGCAAWSSTDDEGNLLDGGGRDFSGAAEETMRADCAAFLKTWDVVLGPLIAHGHYTYGQAGHDYWLTRNGHGAGFWDRGLGVVGDYLTNAAHGSGPCDLYVSDAGEIEIQ